MIFPFASVLNALLFLFIRIIIFLRLDICVTAGNLSLPDLTEDIRRRESPLMYINGLSRRVGSFLMISTDIRGLASRCSLIFPECPAVTGSNIVFLLLCPSPLALRLSRSFAIYLTTGFWDSFFNTRTHRGPFTTDT